MWWATEAAMVKIMEIGTTRNKPPRNKGRHESRFLIPRSAVRIRVGREPRAHHGYQQQCVPEKHTINHKFTIRGALMPSGHLRLVKEGNKKSLTSSGSHSNAYEGYFSCST